MKKSRSLLLQEAGRVRESLAAQRRLREETEERLITARRRLSWLLPEIERLEREGREIAEQLEAVG